MINDPDRHFFTSGGSSLISENGRWVVLLSVGETNIEPVLCVYNQSGTVLLEEKVDLLSVDDIRISRNERYLLLDGWIEKSTGGGSEKHIVIDLDSPSVRWSEVYSNPAEAKEIYENQSGGFDVVINGTTRYSFPR